MTGAKEERKETMEKDEWILPKDHVVRKPRNVERKARCDEIEDANENRHQELHEEDLDDEEDEVCLLRCNDEKRAEHSRNDKELTEHEYEIDFFNLLIDECVCNNLCNVCLRTLTHEENKILQEEAKVESKTWKDKLHAEKA